MTEQCNLTMRIEIRKLNIDEYGYDPPHTEIFISDNGFSARHEEYIDDIFWLEFSRKLLSFPRNLKHEVTFGNGHSESSASIFLRAFVYDEVGKSALEIKVNRPSAPPHFASTHFYILCEAATLNRLGKSLEYWINSGARDFIFPDD